MQFTPIQSRPLDLSIPKSPAQLERERNVAGIQESMRRQREAEAEALANRWLPDPLPRGIALTPDQGAYGIMRIRAGFSPYDDTRVDPVTGYPLTDAPAPPRFLNTNVNFTQLAQSAAQNNATAAPPPAAPTTGAQAYDESAMAAGKLIPQAQFNAPLNADVDQLIAWMEANPGVLPPSESFKTIRFTQRTKAEIDAMGQAAVQQGLEEGTDMGEVRKLSDYLENKFPRSWGQVAANVHAVASPIPLLRGLFTSYDALDQAHSGLVAQNKTDRVEGADKYYHALGNFDAARASPGGEVGATAWSFAKEARDWSRGDAHYILQGDFAANNYGRLLARLLPGESGVELLRPLLLKRTR